MKNSKFLSFYLIGALLILAPLFIQIACSSKSSPSNPAGNNGPTNTPTVTSTPTNSLSAYVTLGSGTLVNPLGVQYISGHLSVVDNGANNLQSWTTTGSSIGSPVTGYGSPVTHFSYPQFNYQDVNGNKYVVDQGNYQVAVFNSGGSFVTLFGHAQMTSSSRPYDVAVNNAGTTLYLSLGNSLLVYSISGSTYTYQSTFTPTGNGALSTATSLWVDGADYLYVGDYYNHRVVRFASNLNYSQPYTSSQLVSPWGIYVDASYKLYVTDYNGFVEIFNSSGTVTGQFGEGILTHPYGITTDGLGNYFVADWGNGRVVGFH